MMTLHRILCPVDFSDASARALRQAVAIARWHEADVTVLYVEDVLLHAASVEASGYPDLVARQREDLRAFVDGAGGNGPNVRVRTSAGDAVSGILTQAAGDRSDLIVMGTNGRSGLARAIVGSVTERVVRESMVPVLTIPPSAEWGTSGELVPFDPILCASDFSPACRQALDLAILMGQEADARVFLLHALQRSDTSPGSARMPLPPGAGIDLEASRKQALARLKRGLPADAVFRCRPEPIVATGSPADAILQAASREDVKLIVMGVQSRGALDRLLFGSTTRRVMQAATCPVLSIRANETAAPWPAGPLATPERVAAASTAV